MQSMILLFVILAIICAAPANKKSRKRASARGASTGRSSTTTISIRPKRQSSAKKPPAFDMAYEYDYAAEQYYALAESLMSDAAREPDSTKSNRLRCRAAEAMLKADRHALKAQG